MKTTGFTVLFFIFLVLTAGVYGQQLKGTVYQKSFTGPVTGKTVYFNIYLPEGYSGAAGSYPVIYQLHGLSETRGGVQNTLVPQYYEAARDSAFSGKYIVVFPEGFNDSFWADSKDGSKPAETNLVKELIPYIDANYRTIPDRRHRVIQGFSMGGFGAAKFIAKYPELFATAVLYDAAILKWSDLRLLFPSIASGVFGNDESYFNQYSPWYWTPVNAAKLKDSVRIRFVVGQYPVLNTPYRDLLISYSIPREYYETGCSHDLACLYSRDGMSTAKFIAQTIPPAFSISGKFLYANSQNSLLPGFSVLLVNQTSSFSVSVISGADGAYMVDNLPNGNYFAAVSPLSPSYLSSDCLNSTDALLIRKFLASLASFSNMQQLAADVNGSGSVSSTDALLLRKRIAGLDPSYIKPEWISDAEESLSVNYKDVVKNITFIIRGDVNSSFSIP
jgi:endo-1,4-beta-xylanase